MTFFLVLSVSLGILLTILSAGALLLVDAFESQGSDGRAGDAGGDDASTTRAHIG